jgi:hypothetical protein
MIAYVYNISPSDTNNLATRAVTLAQRASAVESGRFRRGWKAYVSGNRLVVYNNVRYAMFVELGTRFYTGNRYRIRNALNSLKLGNPQETVGISVRSLSAQAVTVDTEVRTTQDVPVRNIPRTQFTLPKIPKVTSPIIEHMNRRRSLFSTVFGLSAVTAALAKLREEQDGNTQSSEE